MDKIKDGIKGMIDVVLGIVEGAKAILVDAIGKILDIVILAVNKIKDLL